MDHSKNEELLFWLEGVIERRVNGLLPSILRSTFFILSLIYGRLMALKGLLYQLNILNEWIFGIQIISIGNITMGGTGKTPVVELLAKRLQEKGRKVAIISSGYKSSHLEAPQIWEDSKKKKPYDWEKVFATYGLNLSNIRKKGSKSAQRYYPKVVSDGHQIYLNVNHAGDEPMMLAKNLNGVSVVVGKKRRLSAHFAIEQLNCDTLILDDGMQYLDMHHDHDFVLIDSGNPFHNGHLIPRGKLREHPKNLARASCIMLTKCKGNSNTQLISQIRRYNKVADIVECTHAAKKLIRVFDDDSLGPKEIPLYALQGKHVAALSGIAVPQSFEDKLTQLGARVEFHKSYPDHHNFSQEEIDTFMDRCLKRSIDLVITTEKDAVRFLKPTILDTPVYYLRIEIEILRGQELFDRIVNVMSGKIKPHLEGPSIDANILTSDLTETA